MSERPRLHLVYVGAGAELAPAASLRALQGAGAVLVPPEVDADLLAAIAAAAGAPPGVVDVEQATDLLRAGADPVIALAGPRAPELARSLLAVASQTDAVVRTTPARPLFDDCLTGQQLMSLQQITRTLRERCPWDRVQTATDIISYSLEEVYELADAIAAGDLSGEHDELGDVLFQVYFLSLLLQEQGAGDLGSVAEAIEVKLVRRHPHIFADAVADTPAAVRGRWEKIKREQEGREGVFHSVPTTLSALLHARKLQRRAAEVGFDWDTALQAFPKIAEEHAELARAMAAHGPVPEFDAFVPEPEDRHNGAGEPRESEAPSAAQVEMRHDPRVRHELGDLLFAVVNVARKAGVDPELALREAAARFERRVTGAAELARSEGVDWTTVGLDEQERYYQRAKRMEGEGRA